MTTGRTRTRADLVQAASRLFAARGYHGTSMRDLAREVGLLGSSLYSHIESKEDLLVEVVERGSSLFHAAAERAVAEPGSGTDRLRALVSGHIDVVLDHLDEVRTFLYEADVLDTVHRARVIAARDRYESSFREVLTAGRLDGSFRADLDPRLAAIFLLSILNAVERWYHPDRPLTRSQLVDRLVSFTMDGIGATDGDIAERRFGRTPIVLENSMDQATS
ncbi:MAG: TetR family transcriptional regulator [Actinomycetota bacterium]